MLNICGFMLPPHSNNVLMSTHWTGTSSGGLHLATTCGAQHRSVWISSHGKSAPPAADLCQTGWLERRSEQDNATLTPDEVIAHLRPGQWLDWVTLHSNNLLVSIMFNIFSPDSASALARPANRPDYLLDCLPLLDGHLAKGGFLAGGEFSYADLNLLAILDPLQLAQVDLRRFPHLRRWQQALAAQPVRLTVHRLGGCEVPPASYQQDVSGYGKRS